MRAIITGVGGFIGHHVAERLLNTTDWDLIGLDSWHAKHKGDRARIGPELEPHVQSGRLELHRVDLNVPISVQMENILLSRKRPGDPYAATPIDYIFNLASDSHVTRSIYEPGDCWLNNTRLIYHMLEFARRLMPYLRRFVQISTDEVYGDAGWDGDGHPEWATIMPSNPYSASKAAQEALCIAYWRTYNLPVVITNTMNVIGERQDPEKFLPKVIQTILRGGTVQIHADSPKRIARRVWLDAKNMADALRFIARRPTVAMYDGGKGAARPDRYNIVGETELDVLSLARKVAGHLGRELKHELVHGDDVRPGYDRRYALDGSKLRDEGWTPPFTFEQTLNRVVTWTTQHPEWTVIPPTDLSPIRALS